jgi:hypothetical protein
LPLIWAAISAHGFGHAAQVVPVLNALGELVPDLRVLLRTTVPASFFQDRLVIPWSLSPVQQDIGCIQEGPLTIDVEATWREHQRFHDNWSERVDAEIEVMSALRPDLILADTPYLALTAGRHAGIPTAALVSFTWDLVLSQYQAPSSIDKPALLHAIQQAYTQADFALRITPAPQISLFAKMTDIGPIAAPAASVRALLAEALALAPNEQTVLVGFGGIPVTSLPLDQLEGLRGYRFLFDGPLPNSSSQIVSLATLPLSFKSVMASVDIIMTKPGYGTLVEAVALQIPLVYVRRYNFADEQPLLDYLHRYGRGSELSQEDFRLGRWHQALDQTLNLPKPNTPPPLPTGAHEAARRLAPYLQRAHAFG